MLLIALFVAFCNINVRGEDSDESRFIDLLPEDKKEDFLQQIARRIYDDAKVIENDKDFVDKTKGVENAMDAEVTTDREPHEEIDENFQNIEAISKNASDEKSTETKDSDIIYVKPLQVINDVPDNEETTNTAEVTTDTDKPIIFLNETHIISKANETSASKNNKIVTNITENDTKIIEANIDEETTNKQTKSTTIIDKDVKFTTDSVTESSVNESTTAVKLDKNIERAGQYKEDFKSKVDRGKDNTDLVIEGLRGILADIQNYRKDKMREKAGDKERDGVKEYVVYEVDHEPFKVKTTITNKNEPHYAPIYDFSPANAYYNAKNLNGPDSDTKADAKGLDSDAFDIRGASNNVARLKPNLEDTEVSGSILRAKCEDLFDENTQDFHSPEAYNCLKGGLNTIRKILYERQRFGFSDPDENYEYYKLLYPDNKTDLRGLKFNLNNPDTKYKGIPVRSENLYKTKTVKSKRFNLKDILKVYDYVKRLYNNLTGELDDVDTYATVLNDMIFTKNKVLKSYDWLGTAVNLRSGMKKLSDLLISANSNLWIHPTDKEMLKYVTILIQVSKTQIISEIHQLYQSVKQRKQINISKTLKQVDKLKVLEKVKNENIDRKDLEDTAEIIEMLNIALYDLHRSLKYIATTTKYNNQNWYEKLHKLYFKKKKKQLLEILIHIFANEFVISVEDSCRDGASDDLMFYLRNNSKAVQKTVELSIIVLKFINALNKL